MFIKLTSIIVAIIIFGILSRVFKYVMHKINKSVYSIIFSNILTFLCLHYLVSYVFKDTLILENITSATLLLTSPLFIWLVVDLINLPSSFDKNIKLIKFEFSFITFLVIISSIASVVTLIYYPTKSQQSAHQLRDDVNALMENTAEYNEKLTDIKLLDETPSMEGEKGEHEKFFREIVNASISLRIDYQTKLNNAETHLLLDPSRLRGALNITHTQKILNNTLEIIERFKLKNEQILHSAKTKFENLDIKDSQKDLMRYDFNKSISKSMETLKEQWEMEKTVVIKTAEIAVWLGENNEGWLFENNQFLFYSEDDIEYFNNHILEVNKIIANQVEITKKTKNKIDKAFKNIQ